jgi:hypothetical protein
MLLNHLELAQRLRGLSDRELLRYMQGDLLLPEREVALAEASRRGLYLEALKVLDRDAPIPVARGRGPLRVCGSYLSPLDAQVLAACLQNEGLSVQVMDADSFMVRGPQFGSLTQGGVRVMVPDSQLEAALRVRARYDAGELAIDEDFDVGIEEAE